MNNPLFDSPLSQRSQYVDKYDKKLLFPIPRQLKRDELGINASPLPFYGVDMWTAYELSWLNERGKPEVAIADIRIPCESPNLIESKSFKLYLNSFNSSKFLNREKVTQHLESDLTEAAGASVSVRLVSVEGPIERMSGAYAGVCLDHLDVACSEYLVNPRLLRVLDESVDKTTLYSHLLKSNCLVTGQPDWGSISIIYTGRRIDEASLLRYLVSFRNHLEFHEQCVERIFTDLMTYCAPQSLTVYARYTRRGGLDINPIRSSNELVNSDLCNEPLFRQ